MSSLLTNTSALTALQNLAATQRNLQTTQNQISTGLKISSAADNAAVWSTAQTMSSDNGALGSVSSSLAYSGSMLDTFTSALQQAITVTNNIKNDLVSAQQPGADLSKIQTDIAAQQSALKSISGSANFNGQNWLSNDTTAAGDGGSQSLVASYNNKTGVGFLTVSTSATQLIDTSTGAGTTTDTGILSKDGASATGVSVLTMDVTNLTTTNSLANMLTDVNTALGSLDTAASTIGSARSNVTTQSAFISSLQNSLTAGVGSLVDADMNAASTRLQALQTQQSLGVQSLSIANQNTSMIMKLFGG